MKVRYRIFICVLILILAVSSLLTSCAEMTSADLLLRNFCAAFPLTRGRVYSSEVRANEEGHLTEEMLDTLFGEGERPLYSSSAVYLCADMDGVEECGVFVVREGLGAMDDIVRTQDFFYSRIRTVRLAFPMTEGRVMRFGRVIVYCILSDTERAEHLFSRLIN